jgi:hypothetical protein
MNSLSKNLAFMCLAGFSFSVYAQKPNSDTLTMDQAMRVVAEKQGDQELAHIVLAPIRSLADLRLYMQNHPLNPLNALAPRSLEKFVDSLTFNTRGLTSYRTAEIETELTPRQAYAVLSLFGVQDSIGQLRFSGATADEIQALQALGPTTMDGDPGDYPGYRCVPPATCLRAVDSICIGRNCTGGNP